MSRFVRIYFVSLATRARIIDGLSLVQNEVAVAGIKTPT